MPTPSKLRIPGRVLLLGCGAVSQCLQPLLLRHVDMDFSRLTIMDFADLRERIPVTLARGARYVQDRLTPDNYAAILDEQLGPGDLLVDLAWNLSTSHLVEWCHDHGVLYVNASVEVWDPYAELASTPPTERALYGRHMDLRALASRWTTPGPTAVVEHGANPGLVSHWVKVALTDIATKLLHRQPTSLEAARRGQLEQALADRDWARLAMVTRTKVIHISERDTQISVEPKQVGEFVNTWSPDGFIEEATAPAEAGWGTHERTLPYEAFQHQSGPRNQISLAQPGMQTWVRSWVPAGGPIWGMVIRHGEAFTISDYLTVWDGDHPEYRPTVHYAYLPADAAIASLHECGMTGYHLQQRQRVMGDDIIGGADELGVLLLGHDLGGWWTGSQLDIHETRKLVGPGQNATTLQVAASMLGALGWMLEHPKRGLCIPDQLDHEPVLDLANPYLGPCPSIRTDWTPLAGRVDLFERFNGRPQPTPDDVWQFATFRAP
jgi:homospermidine synthase